MDVIQTHKRSRSHFWLLALFVAVIQFVTMPAQECPGDAVAVRHETEALLSHGTLAVDPKIASTFGERGQYFYQNPKNQKWYPKYGILNTFVYVPPLLAARYCNPNGVENERRQLLFLNIWGIVIAVATTFYLYLFCGRYTQSDIIKIVYILTAIYCTFWWNHLRALAFETFTPLLLIAAAYHFSLVWAPPAHGFEKKGKYHLLAAGTWLGLLALAKAVYFALTPVFIAVFVVHAFNETNGTKNRLWRSSILKALLWFSLPVILALAVHVAACYYRFGSPFSSGYTQWSKEKHLFSGNLWDGITGFFFDPQFSIFVCFPILFFALFKARAFARQYPWDLALVLSLGLTLLLINSKFINWRGCWSYGPRYMLPPLGLMSLPFVLLLEDLARNSHKLRTWIIGSVIAVTLAYSLVLQCNVNALPFYTFFYLEEMTQTTLNDPQIAAYFWGGRHFGLINGDLLDFLHGKPWFVLERTKKIASPRVVIALKVAMYRSLQSNYYWFADDVHEPGSTAKR